MTTLRKLLFFFLILVILGAGGVLQFDVVAHRLQHEYGVDCRFESVTVATARWVQGEDPAEFDEFKKKINEQGNYNWDSDAAQLASLMLDTVLDVMMSIDDSLDRDSLRQKLKNHLCIK